MDKRVEVDRAPESYGDGGIFVSGQFLVRPEHMEVAGFTSDVVLAIKGELFVLTYDAATALAYGLVQSLRAIDEAKNK